MPSISPKHILPRGSAGASPAFLPQGMFLPYVPPTGGGSGGQTLLPRAGPFVFPPLMPYFVPPVAPRPTAAPSSSQIYQVGAHPRQFFACFRPWLFHFLWVYRKVYSSFAYEETKVQNGGTTTGER